MGGENGVEGAEGGSKVLVGVWAEVGYDGVVSEIDGLIDCCTDRLID